ncbi:MULTISPECIES: DUF2280 domain-containing protein [unclassified Psychrobacter]|uniref:DUF2280 domain-containing protein n=1 Tax=unclassified Psychrobacter TaxID=196806 RepID=UPI000C31C9D0|nr:MULTISPECIES: DUF2280 domain-containing protein [unclassified Psychrobacter]MBA6243795.1 DUF2280 domain-containing protein [Psychrobacter sp. Urea-trap-18]MBA6285378.1 DUF2280 domain-containing protein [Psychrobacter sp. Urea-trap-16]MBA6319102.1 DUF2280 domain-containing protein [Psychrobacter sp. Urea-trap-20]MBA6335121.1 DUF2280 domain-containing protein [Psychrobacter sp. Urea-trap-19]PKG59509.1 hypothetical protein CXF63_11220 [Psychrobacter sp. Choline-3u-12]
MATLNTKVKAYIVRGLATYMTPSEVVDAVKQEFGGFVVTRQQVAKYDPNKASGVNLSSKWQELFVQHRKDFNDEINSIPIANKAYRLKLLDDMAREALESKNKPLAAKLLEQAAKEIGEVFTNKHKVNHVSQGNVNSTTPKPTVIRLTAPSLSDELARAISRG